MTEPKSCPLPYVMEDDNRWACIKDFMLLKTERKKERYKKSALKLAMKTLINQPSL